MEYLQKKFKGRNLYLLVKFLNDLNLDGVWSLHSFSFDSDKDNNAIFFQIYHPTTGAFILAKTHCNHKITKKKIRRIDIYDLDNFVVDKVYTECVDGIKDITDIAEFFQLIEDILLK